jgi:hypothetical protein
MKYTVMTSGEGPDRHAHLAVFDDDGIGHTSTNGQTPHAHEILGGRVLSAVGHTHKLRELIDVPELMTL